MLKDRLPECSECTVLKQSEAQDKGNNLAGPLGTQDHLKYSFLGVKFCIVWGYIPPIFMGGTLHGVVYRPCFMGGDPLQFYAPHRKIRGRYAPHRNEIRREVTKDHKKVKIAPISLLTPSSDVIFQEKSN